MLDFLSKEYEVLQFLGEGASAKIYKVLHKEFGTIRAIRVLKTSVPDKSDKEYTAFLKECKTLLQLGNGGHPNIVRIYKPTLLQGHALVEMDYVKGCDIQGYLESQGNFIPAKEVLRFIQDIGSALAYCHVDCYEDKYSKNETYRYELDGPFKGQTFKIESDPEDGKRDLITDFQKKELIRIYSVIHNDLHSKNIMRKQDGSYILLDFGLSIEHGEFVRSSVRRGGAIEYKAPEKDINEHNLSTQSDVYSFGVLMYQMLAGRVPFPYNRHDYASEEEAVYIIRKKHAEERPLSIAPIRAAAYEKRHPGKRYHKDYPDWLEMMIMKCLHKKPADRYADMHAFMVEFNKYRAGEDTAINDEKVRVVYEENKRLQNDIAAVEKENAELKNRMTTMKNTPAASIINAYEDELIVLEAKYNEVMAVMDSCEAANLKLNAERNLMVQKYASANKKMEEYQKLNAYLNKRIQLLEDGNGRTVGPRGKNSRTGRFLKVILIVFVVFVMGVSISFAIVNVMGEDTIGFMQFWKMLWK